jgi:hypothetical protein
MYLYYNIRLLFMFSLFSYIVFDKMSDGRYITFSVCKCRKHNMVDRDRNKDAT